MRKIKRIFVHCTAGSQRWTEKDLLRFFKEEMKWKAPGYHWVVTADGGMHRLLDEEKVSNGVHGYNATSINVAWVGGIDPATMKSVDNRTKEQRRSLRALLMDLHFQYPDAVILGHRDISPDTNGNGIVDPWERIKDCPCFDVKEEYGDIMRMKL